MLLTDTIEHPTLEGKVSVCAIKDMCSHPIIGDVIDGPTTAQLAVAA